MVGVGEKQNDIRVVGIGACVSTPLTVASGVVGNVQACACCGDGRRENIYQGAHDRASATGLSQRHAGGGARHPSARPRGGSVRVRGIKARRRAEQHHSEAYSIITSIARAGARLAARHSW